MFVWKIGKAPFGRTTTSHFGNPTSPPLFHRSAGGPLANLPGAAHRLRAAFQVRGLWRRTVPVLPTSRSAQSCGCLGRVPALFEFHIRFPLGDWPPMPSDSIYSCILPSMGGQGRTNKSIWKGYSGTPLAEYWRCSGLPANPIWQNNTNINSNRRQMDLVLWDPKKELSAVGRL